MFWPACSTGRHYDRFAPDASCHRARSCDADGVFGRGRRGRRATPNAKRPSPRNFASNHPRLSPTLKRPPRPLTKTTCRPRQPGIAVCWNGRQISTPLCADFAGCLMRQGNTREGLALAERAITIRESPENLCTLAQCLACPPAPTTPTPRRFAKGFLAHCQGG